MTLPASGTMTAAMINVELGRPSNAVFSMNGATERALAGVPSGGINFSNFYGKTGGGGGGETRSAAYLQWSNSLGSVNFGTAHATRRLVGIVQWSEAAAHQSLSSATIGGVAASIHVQLGHSGGLTGLGVAIISAAVPTGTSGAVSLAFSGGGVTNTSIGLIRLVGYSAAPADTRTATASSPNDPLEVNGLNMPAVPDGLIIAGYTGSTLTDSDPVTWSGSASAIYDLSDSVRKSGSFAGGLGPGIKSIGAAQEPVLNAGNALAVASWG